MISQSNTYVLTPNPLIQQYMCYLHRMTRHNPKERVRFSLMLYGARKNPGTQLKAKSPSSRISKVCSKYSCEVWRYYYTYFTNVMKTTLNWRLFVLELLYAIKSQLISTTKIAFSFFWTMFISTRGLKPSLSWLSDPVQNANQLYVEPIILTLIVKIYKNLKINHLLYKNLPAKNQSCQWFHK